MFDQANSEIAKLVGKRSGNYPASPCLFPVVPFGYRLFLRPLFNSSNVPSEVEALPFDRDRWMAGEACLRVGMARFLADRKVLGGKTRVEKVGPS